MYLFPGLKKKKIRISKAIKKITFEVLNLRDTWKYKSGDGKWSGYPARG